MADVQNTPRTTGAAGTSTTLPQGSPQGTPQGSPQGQPQGSRSVEPQRGPERDAGREMLQKAQDLTAEGKAVATEYYEQGRDRMVAWQQQLEIQVRDKPLQSLLMAAGIGLLFGLLKRR